MGSTGQAEWRDTRRNRVSCGSTSSGSRGIAAGEIQSQASDAVLHRLGSTRLSGRRPQEQSRQQARVSEQARVSSDSINVEESPMSMNQEASEDLFYNVNRNPLDRSGRRSSSRHIVDLCGDGIAADSNAADGIAAGSNATDGVVTVAGSNATTVEPTWKRNREVDDEGEPSDKRMRGSASSVEATIEGDTSVSEHFRHRNPRFRRRRPERALMIGVGDATGQNRPMPIVVDDLDSPQQSGNERPRVRLAGDRERLSRQMAADERFARELQGAYELDGAVGEYDDAYLARVLQDEENAGMIDNDGVPLNTRFLLQSLLQPVRSTHVEQRNHPGGATSSRIRLAQRVGRTGGSSRLRARLRLHRTMPADSGRRIPFPSNMAVEARVEILAALEATIQEQFTEALQLMQVDRDFNENDYEMLLALDDNVRRGASQAKIELLPVRTILPTDVLEEVCSICLELPVAGEVVRRLPCIHEFHQNCIDQWLCRQGACPVCKADIDIN
ncbi:hypothetical protein O6H91_02G128300 [Diphasiastrum complanatum]|uniref:Uncharacterized protein n=1 Tax=Diphasiastrum complanatum TaxID=34168 RepID=A0ACC2EKM5_DIPCM|nr:hypothetical protein O6H91_02G128300 [Diphasiastrum complanatum]